MATATAKKVSRTKQRGTGPLPHRRGVAFRVWAPAADRVAVVGSFNGWSPDSDPMQREGDGHWYRDIPAAAIGDEYRYCIESEGQTCDSLDPYARELTAPGGNAIVHDPHFDWTGDSFHTPPLNELVIYGLHVGTFYRPDPALPGTFRDVARRLDYLQSLGVNAIELLPVNTFVGSASWGDQPSHLFAVENSYGGPRALKQFIKVAHEAGLCVILDVVYHHFAGQEDARRTIRDNVRMWIEEYHFDGLRIAGTSFIRSLDGANGDSRRTGEGWKLLREINVQLEREYPGRLCIAEDLHDDAALTVHPRDGGAGFSAQWQYDFAARVRRCTVAAWDDHRSMDSLRSVLEGRLGCDAFKRVLFTECHDKRSPAAMRLPSAICPDQPESWWSRKRSTLAAGLLLTAPGVPMLFQGQEFLQTGPFDEAQPLDWPRSEHFAGILQLYRDLLHLRLNREGHTRGLCGQGVHCFHVDDERKVIAYRRWDRGGIKDDVLVVANCAHEPRIDYRIGLPLDGAWKLRFNSDARVYCDDFADIGSGDMVAQDGPCGGLPYHAVLSIGPYSLQIYSHEAAPVV